MIASSVHAFSLGPMEVVSDFGEKFNAEIELQANPDKPIKVSIGSPEDYLKSGVPRPSVVDELVLPGKIENRDGLQILRVLSPLPLFHPSFNLVIRAEQAGDIIMENYLVSVDFKQSVSLRLKAEREKDKQAPPEEPEPKPEESVDEVVDAGLTPEEETPETPIETPVEKPVEEPEAVAAGKASEEEQQEAAPGPQAPPVVVAVHPAPLVVRELPEIETPELEPLPTPVAEPAPPAVVIQAPKKPEPRPAAKEELARQVARVPSPEKKEEPPAPEKLRKAPEPGKPPVVLSRETYGPLKKGESLESIVSDLKLSETERQKAAVALWMNNQDKFIKGNIHGLASGVELNLTSLDAKMKEVSSHRARWTIQNHWQEWELIKDRLKLASELDLPPMLAELLTSPPDNELQRVIHERVEAWRSSWEKEDLKSHLALFSEQPAKAGKFRGMAYWKRFKGMMFKRHKQVRLKIGKPLVVLHKDWAFVGFDQWFDSNRMQSYGRKTLEWVLEGGVWKIANEHFAVKKFFNKLKESGSENGPVTEADFSKPESLTHPIVVHASTKLNLASAVKVLNRLRDQGFHAYIAPLYVTPVKKIYRILVSRLSDWGNAEDLTRAVRKIPSARFAAPKRFPFSLKAGEFLKESEAKSAEEELRKKGISTYRLSAGGGNFPNPVIQILVGAFLEKDNALRYAGELKKSGLKTELVSP
ncbi:MAG: hypothetical protein G3M70_12120 [Candidatus Nitronauta litoralis]|uniref:SPOR domain-containing protein n=1 Tax=Candidatus Nitronauta litoralis TaxID=2705533 RepID=A0A7T0BXB7_9BACT|nr:MAG: hypothetical protein G3M70_12120 [Candidatus Nitronauta litoralis]